MHMQRETFVKCPLSLHRCWQAAYYPFWRVVQFVQLWCELRPCQWFRRALSFCFPAVYCGKEPANKLGEEPAWHFVYLYIFADSAYFKSDAVLRISRWAWFPRVQGVCSLHLALRWHLVLFVMLCMASCRSVAIGYLVLQVVADWRTNRSKIASWRIQWCRQKTLKHGWNQGNE